MIVSSNFKFIPVGQEARYGLSTIYGDSEDFEKLPKKGLASGNVFFNLDTQDVYIFKENIDKNKDGEWVSL